MRSVLATLVKNKVVPDPFYGLQNETIIDIADSGRDFYTFWFFTTFHCKLVRFVLCNYRFSSFRFSSIFSYIELRCVPAFPFLSYIDVSSFEVVCFHISSVQITILF